jgi:hypothetical protein
MMQAHMKQELRQFEALVERDMQLLSGALNRADAGPTQDCLERITHAAAAQLDGRLRFRLAPQLILIAATAAALVMALTPALQQAPARFAQPAFLAESDPAASFEAWSLAIDASGELLERSRALVFDEPQPESEEFEAFFDGLEGSIETLELGS